ncbi:hypothetical protein [Catellatospora tritici]|uniref:hypothetical protein n=1 Tax=Catellatospora tritici TaxID=2851566 RepID=UPI001C2D5671|nr:hypothetical protein [Catellatospora tritici]MBV1853537.1 hypothetical protein [Catellatospora tritici]
MTTPGKDSGGDTVMKDGSPVNTYGLTDNCYYVTAAQLLNTTVGELTKRTEIMQEPGEQMTMTETQTFFQGLGLPAQVTQYGTLAAVEQAFRALGATTDRQYALGFQRTGGSRHMVVAHYRPQLMQSVRYHDYQNPDSSAALDLAGATAYYLFH